MMRRGNYRRLWLLLAVAGISLTGMTYRTHGEDAPMTGSLNLPLETATTHGEWVGNGTFRHTVDAVNGRLALEYVEALTSTGTDITMDIDRVDLAEYDLLRFDWRSTGDDILVQVSVEGYPSGRRLNYYLNKNPVQRGDWQRVWLDLALDDDNPFLADVEVPEGKLRIRLKLALNPVAQASPQPQVAVRLAEMMLVRLPVRVTGDLRAIRELDEDDRVGQVYTLQVTNQTTESRQAVLYLDRSGLSAFSVELSAERFELAAGETREVEARMTVAKEVAARLAPLHLEEASIFAGVEGEPDTLAPWTWGYMQHRLRGAVPLAPRPAPLLLDDAEGDAGRARLAGNGESVASPQLLKTATERLDFDPVPPTLLYGNPNAYRCPEHNAQLRFVGPGQHRCDKGRELVDVATMSEPVLRAAAFAHHNHLSHTALILAQAGWESGDLRYLRRAAEILMNYARTYRDNPISDPSATAFYARVSRGNLQESWWFAPLPRAFDFVRAAGIWTPEEEELVARDLILEGVVLMRSHRSIANQQAEYNRAVGVGALAIGHDVLAAESLDGEYGMRAQWKLDFDGDGWTMERDLGYQRAAIMPFLDFARALAANQVPVFDAEFKKLFDAPVHRSSNMIAVPGDFYTTAYEAYGDPLYLRSRAAALREPVPAPADGFPNSVQPAAGFTMLRSGQDDRDLVAASLNWGEPSHRSGRVLFNPLIRWRGHGLNAHVERIAYGSHVSGFSYTAAAGNSLLVDGELQSMARADQVALLDGPLPAGRWLAPATRPQYPGMAWARSMAICGDTVLVLDQWSATRALRVDHFTYLPGNVMSAITAGGDEVQWAEDAAFSTQGHGYKYFTEARLATGAAPRRITYELQASKEFHGQLQMLGPEAMRIFSMQAPIGWHPRQVPVWAMRQTDATSGWFATAFTGGTSATLAAVDVERLEVTVNGEPIAPEQALAIRITHADRRYLVLTSALEAEHLIDGRRIQGPLAVLDLNAPDGADGAGD